MSATVDSASTTTHLAGTVRERGHIGLVVLGSIASALTFGLLLVLSGANVPIDQLPGWMQTISSGIPFTHGIEAARRLADGAALGDVGGLVLREAVIGVVYGVFGYAIIRAMEVLGRRNATLERA